MSDFFAIVGAQRCGTTWLYSRLEHHPDITMAKPVRPEPKFFLDAQCIATGKSAYLQRYFSAVQSGIIGEKSTSYLEYPAAGEAIKRFFPTATILIMVRNPVERAISNYFFSVKNGLETRSIEDVFLNNVPAPSLPADISIDPFQYVQRGEYARYIKPFRELFGADRVKIIINEVVTSDQGALASVFRFLGVDERFQPAGFSEIVNQSNRGECVPEVVRQSLSEHYQASNKALREYADISSWDAHV
ncbi:MAG: sulfotransferase [Arenicellales bacterium]|nr:sulfotransferase [Arenicellales bacterium]